MYKESRDQSNENDQHLTFISIIQSSGCGKSRVVEETRDLIFSIPFNLRSIEDDTGVPSIYADPSLN